jgi:NADH:ubiquinone oxidoreductase subunit 5 (subunit L)/multisubunit Na+/H+ antiporter MnhA subunit
MDIKKIVAISTLSQLGLMLYVLFQRELELAFTHISCHAMFKALLFLSCGVLIIKSFGIQDSREKGILTRRLFITRISLVGSNLRLIGFPFTAGFYSKDLIIERIFFDSIIFSRIFFNFGLYFNFYLFNSFNFIGYSTWEKWLL